MNTLPAAYYMKLSAVEFYFSLDELISHTVRLDAKLKHKAAIKTTSVEQLNVVEPIDVDQSSDTLFYQNDNRSRRFNQYKRPSNSYVDVSKRENKKQKTQQKPLLECAFCKKHGLRYPQSHEETFCNEKLKLYAWGSSLAGGAPSKLLPPSYKPPNAEMEKEGRNYAEQLRRKN